MRPALLRVFFLGLVILSIAHLGDAQQSLSPTAQTVVPPLVRFTGTVPASPEGRVVATFALYSEQAGGQPLWSETQVITRDATGRYSVLLGATHAEGVPREVFAAGAARWVGVQVEGQPELPRVLLISVPYALKAEDAETIAGRPLSAFVLTGEKTGRGEDGLTYVNPATLGAALGGAFVPTANAGTANYIGRFTNTTDLGNSVLFQAGSSIGLGTTAPAAAFHVVGTVAPGAFFDVAGTLGALPVVYRAARGTPAAPTAVQPDDILGGLAVRGFGATTYGPGVGQVMYRAAEPFTDTARGTYLTMTTTPLGSGLWAERMRIDPAGNVGIGTAAPAQKLSVAGTIESTLGGFKFPDGTTQASALSQAANTFAGTQTITSGNLALPATSSANSGVLTLGGQPFLHSYGATTYENTFVGHQAGTFSGSGSGGNTGLGYQALAANGTGYYNVALGMWTLAANTTGAANVAVGTGAMYRNVSGVHNTAVGYGSLGYVTGASYNSAFGAYSLSKVTGANNSAFGTGALANATATDGNSAFGYYALGTTSTAGGNSAFGYQALTADTTGHDNDAFGNQALAANETGSYNVVVGSNSLRASTGGSYNVALGRNIATLGTGDSNAGVGYGALYNLTSGTQNTAVGTDSGYRVTSGSNNTFLGYFAATDAAHPDITNATAIGANALVTQSNSLVLGGPLGTGNEVSVGIGTSAPNTTLQVVGNIRIGTGGTNGCLQRFDGAALAGTCSSDARLKTNIRPFAPVLDRLARLRPVHYTWKAADFPSYHFGPGTQSGLVAQEVEQVFPEMVGTDEHGYKMVNYSEVPLLTLAAVRELNDTLRAENDALKAQLAALSERLVQLEKRIR